MIVVTDPESTPALSDEVLQVTFHLTRAEARLAQLLVRGVSMRDAAVQLGLSVETVRTRLKTVFGKTATTRQAELVALLVRTAKSLHGAVP